MDSETARIEHLKLIQVVVDRMSRNSFSIKAGALTLVAGLLAVAFGINHWMVAAIGMIPIAILWGLDAFFIRQERIFRQLYDTIRLGLAPEIGSAKYFSMDINQIQSEVKGIPKTMFTRTLPFFYIPLLAVLAVISIIIGY